MSKLDAITGLYVPSKTFKMPKTFKRMGASIVSKEARDAFKNAMIQAVLMGQDKPVKEKKTNPNGKVELMV